MIAAFTIVPVIGLGVIYLFAYRHLRRRDGINRIAARWALIVSWLTLLGWTLYVLGSVALSQDGTAIFGIFNIPVVGIPLALITLAVVWAIFIGAVSLHPRRFHEKLRKPSFILASGIVFLAAALGASRVNSARLQSIAQSETSPDVLRRLSEHSWARRDSAVLKCLARNTRTPPHVLTNLASHHDSSIRHGVAGNANTPAPVLEQLYDDPYNRTSLAVNPNAPATMLRRLATDFHQAVRVNLLFNRSLSLDVLEDLQKDPAVSKLASRALQRRREGGGWFIVAPPYTTKWSAPFTRVVDDRAPMEQWSPTGHRFETSEACEESRTELVRRESSPQRIEAIKRTQRTGRGYQPLDFYAHTRCAYVDPR